MPVNSFEDLDVWRIAMSLVSDVYAATKSFPREEQYGLTSQIRRSAVSIPSNIAEGHARSSTKDFLRHLSIALGSLAELETQLILAENLEYLALQQLDCFRKTTSQVGRMLRGLQRSLQSRLDNSRPRDPDRFN